ncbi:antitermination regulator, partial [Amycolatopsis mediterranei]
MIGDERLPAEDQAIPVLPSPAEVSANLARLADTVARLRGEVDHAHAVADGRGLIELAKGVDRRRLGGRPGHRSRREGAGRGRPGPRR